MKDLAPISIFKLFFRVFFASLESSNLSGNEELRGRGQISIFFFRTVRWSLNLFVKFVKLPPLPLSHVSAGFQYNLNIILHAAFSACSTNINVLCWVPGGILGIL